MAGFENLSNFGEVTNGRALVGFGIEVYWPDDAEFFKGRISKYALTTGKHTVDYEDGDKEVLMLKDERARLLDPKTWRPVDLPADALSPAKTKSSILKLKKEPDAVLKASRSESEGLGEQPSEAPPTKKRGRPPKRLAPAPPAEDVTKRLAESLAEDVAEDAIEAAGSQMNVDETPDWLQTVQPDEPAAGFRKVQLELGDFLHEGVMRYQESYRELVASDKKSYQLQRICASEDEELRLLLLQIDEVEPVDDIACYVSENCVRLTYCRAKDASRPSSSSGQCCCLELPLHVRVSPDTAMAWQVPVVIPDTVPGAGIVLLLNVVGKSLPHKMDVK